MNRTKPKQNRAETTLARIRAAARAVIEREGRDRFTMSQICAETGMSVGILYRYFSDKLAILDDLYPNRVEGLGEVADGASTGGA